MSAVLPAPFGQGDGARHVAAVHDARSRAPAIDHVLDCVAGFHACEAEARSLSQRLTADHGLMPEQLVLLRPADAAWLSFMRQRRHWARSTNAEGQTWLGDAWLMAPSGAMAAGLLGALWLLVDGHLGLGLGDGGELAALACVLTLGALGGFLLAERSARTPQYRRFDDVIRHQLSSGRWVVLAHDLPWQQQAGVVDLVRDQGLDWCAVASARRWL